LYHKLVNLNPYRSLWTKHLLFLDGTQVVLLTSSDFWLSYRPFGFTYSQRLLNNLTFQSFELERTLWKLCHKRVMALNWISMCSFCQWLTAGRWFSPCTPVSTINKTDRHDITEIQNVLLKVTLNTISLTLRFYFTLEVRKAP
jgi:hypothetical protein